MDRELWHCSPGTRVCCGFFYLSDLHLSKRNVNIEWRGRKCHWINLTLWSQVPLWREKSETPGSISLTPWWSFSEVPGIQGAHTLVPEGTRDEKCFAVSGEMGSLHEQHCFPLLLQGDKQTSAAAVNL